MRVTSKKILAMSGILQEEYQECRGSSQWAVVVCRPGVTATLYHTVTHRATLCHTTVPHTVPHCHSVAQVTLSKVSPLGAIVQSVAWFLCSAIFSFLKMFAVLFS